MKISPPLRSFFFIYKLLWKCATPLLLRSPRLQEGAAERTLKKISFSKVDLWIHAASIGEAYVALQLIQNLDKNQTIAILITCNTSQGKEILEKNIDQYPHYICVAYMVFDDPSLVKKAVEIANPQLLVLIELEIWPALMLEMKKQHKKIIIVNGRMTEKSFNGYKKARFLWKAIQPDLILASTEEYRHRLQIIFEQEQTIYVPNIKFDQIKNCSVAPTRQNDPQSLILASIRKEEEQDVLWLTRELLAVFPALQIDLFPRHLHRVKHWETMLTDAEICCCVKTNCSPDQSSSVIIWDVFGELTNCYQRADAAFIGGSLAPLGGQNFVEAFMNGLLPVTGPSVYNFSWAGDEVFQQGLVKKGRNREEVLQLLVTILKNPPDKAAIRQRADKYIHLKQGGSRKTCQHIVGLLAKNSPQHTIT